MQPFADKIRGAAQRAAQRQQPDGPPRTRREDLEAWAHSHLRGQKLVVVSNREPYSHVRDDDGVRWIRNAGGLTVALDAVSQTLGGLWVAHGSGNADRETADDRGRIGCPPDRPRYVLKRVWLSAEDEALYYSGLANSALWPLCHVVYVRPRFRLRDWERYRDVNRRFAEAVLEEIGDEPAFVFLQDYHLALAARFLKERRPDLEVALFWHIPWPNEEVFRIFPWKQELLEGMLANDLIGFHIRYHALNFLDAVSNELEARVDHERIAVERGGKRTWVRHFPISVNATEIAAMSDGAEAQSAARALRQRFGIGEDGKIGLGVDRMDYTKGIPERLEAVERMLEKYPEWSGRFSFVQIGVPSRIELREYRNVQIRTRRRIDRINRRFGTPERPVAHLIEANLDFRELVPYYRVADLCAVTSLHDGMNLVAKEYLASKTDLSGALVLSPFTGAARELERAWLISPYDREGMADAYHRALSEPEDASRERMRALRETVLRRNIFDWAIEVLNTAQRLTLRMPQSEALESEELGRSETP
ncbi:MAG TPA: trehalose-6-phosphate synthase [Candidatus Limnocylindria bacterium]|nr:trehalose-6-phosphate synthase [Candidatus Limnocylindria bacterium]